MAMSKGKATTCAQCSKNLNKKTYYYRNNNYFCNQRCFGLFWPKYLEEKAKKEEEAKAAAEAAAAAPAEEAPAEEAPAEA